MDGAEGLGGMGVLAMVLLRGGDASGESGGDEEREGFRRAVMDDLRNDIVLTADPNAD